MAAHLVYALLAAISVMAAASQPAQADPVRIGIANAISDVSIFIADRKGYFRDEGLSVVITGFASGANMVAPLGVGDLDAGGGSASAGFYNAVARGIKMRIVADKASSLPGYAVNRLIVHKSHVDSGRFKTLADLKGMKVALNAPGVSAQVTLDVALKKGGLTRADIESTNIPMTDYVIALQNKAADASFATEPFATIAVRNGSSISFIGDDELIPGHQIANLLYSEKFATTRADEARRFIKAYLRGIRFYNGALKDGHLVGPNADEVIAIIAETTPVKDTALLRLITPNGCDPDGFINVPSLKLDFDNYKDAGLIIGKVTVEQVIDRSFLEAALREIGPHKPDAPRR